MKTVRIGVIGVGVMGRNHAGWIREGKVSGGCLAAVCDINPAALKGYGDDILKFDDSRN